jgi:MerR-like DNA binding protein
VDPRRQSTLLRWLAVKHFALHPRASGIRPGPTARGPEGPARPKAGSEDGSLPEAAQFWTANGAGSDTWAMDPRGAYTADRAAALSGVPKSTVHYWARREILVPSISEVRIKLWSYSDLMSLRTIAWLRATKTAPDGHDVPATAMSAVRRALQELLELGLDLWTEDVGPSVAVDRRGKIVLNP